MLRLMKQKVSLFSDVSFAREIPMMIVAQRVSGPGGDHTFVLMSEWFSSYCLLFSTFYQVIVQQNEQSLNNVEFCQ